MNRHTARLMITIAYGSLRGLENVYNDPGKSRCASCTGDKVH